MKKILLPLALVIGFAFGFTRPSWGEGGIGNIPPVRPTGGGDRCPNGSIPRCMHCSNNKCGVVCVGNQACTQYVSWCHTNGYDCAQI